MFDAQSIISENEHKSFYICEFGTLHTFLSVSQKSKSKISTEHGSSLSVSNPFAEISSENLPEIPSSRRGPAPVEKKETKSRGRVDVTREKSGRAGKTVTVLSGFPKTIPIAELDAMALKLKKFCACGGSLKERTIELQGDVCEQVMCELEKLRFRPIRCGG